MTALALGTALLSATAQAGTRGVPLKYNNEDFPVIDWDHPSYPHHRYYDIAPGRLSWSAGGRGVQGSLPLL